MPWWNRSQYPGLPPAAFAGLRLGPGNSRRVLVALVSELSAVRWSPCSRFEGTYPLAILAALAVSRQL